jgi:chloramphenicol 3-O-phosphotransferase
MIIFINGSVNAGKSTTSKLVAEKLNAEWIDVDELAHIIPDFDLQKDIPKAIALTVKKINELTKAGKTVVANYVLRQEDYEQLQDGLLDKDQHYFTLAPRLEVARQDRGRGMNEWEYERIKYHYDSGIANPGFGEIIDTSELTLEEVSNVILDKLPA